MADLTKFEGHEFPVADLAVGSSSIDYWFDKEEIEYQQQDNPLVPDGCMPLARDPGDDLILQAVDGSVYYCDHETGNITLLAASLSEFLSTILIDG